MPELAHLSGEVVWQAKEFVGHPRDISRIADIDKSAGASYQNYHSYMEQP
jgi:hypothetical protein